MMNFDDIEWICKHISIYTKLLWSIRPINTLCHVYRKISLRLNNNISKTKFRQNSTKVIQHHDLNFMRYFEI